MTDFIPSGPKNPCPICTRTKDPDCRIKEGGQLVLCHQGKTNHPPEPAGGFKPGRAVTGLGDGQQWAFTRFDDSGRTAVFTLDKPIQGQPKRLAPGRPTAPAKAAEVVGVPLPANASEIALATLPVPLPEEPPDHLPNGRWLGYSPTQRVKIEVGASGKEHIPHSLKPDQTWGRSRGDDPWPLWQEHEAIQHGGGRWIFETEGEKCCDWIRSGGSVAISQPGHTNTPEANAVRYQRLIKAGVAGVVYLADNDPQGIRKAAKCRLAAASVGLPLLVIHAADVWPDLPKGGSIDDAPGTPAERVQALIAAIPAAMEKAREDQGLLEIAPKLIASGWQYPEKGSPRRTKLEVGDACALLRESIGPRLAFNKLTHLAEFNGKPISEEDIADLYCFLSEHGYSIAKEASLDALLSIARQRSFHPVKQYLEAIEKDQSLKPGNLDTLAEIQLGNTSSLAAAMLRKTLIGAVWRAMEPGCKFDAAATLKGPQGWGKSSFWRTLASPAWFIDTMPESHKDLTLNVHSCWIYELAELESVTGKKVVGALKNMLSSANDKFRPPYARSTQDHYRSSIFVASVNNDSFLFDETGNRRFWGIEVFCRPDLARLRADRDALWKAAVLAYRAGELPKLSDEQEAASEAQNKSFVAEDPWSGLISKWAEAPARAGQPFDTAEVIVGAELRDQKQINSHDARRVATCLKRLGYEQDKNPTWVDGTKSRFWRKQAAEQPKHPNPLAQMAQIGTDKNQASVPAQTPDAPTDLNPLEQMEQIKQEIGVGIEVGEEEGRSWRTGETFFTSSVPSPQGGQTTCGSNGFHGTDPPGTDLFHGPLKGGAGQPPGPSPTNNTSNGMNTNNQATPATDHGFGPQLDAACEALKAQAETGHQEDA